MAVGDWIASQGIDRESSNELSGALRLKRTVWSSTDSVEATLPRARYPVEDAVSGSRRWATLARTASALNGVPSVNETSSRSENSQLRPSGASSQVVASHGMISPSEFFDTSDSRYCVATSACG